MQCACVIAAVGLARASYHRSPRRTFTPPAPSEFHDVMSARLIRRAFSRQTTATGVALLVIACGDSTRSSARRAAVVDTLPGGIVRVTNFSRTDSGRWSLEPERTLQPADDSLGGLRAPDDILLLDDGSLLVADAKPAEVVRYDPTGQFVKRIGREGAGPGEYRSPRLAARGDTLVVHDPALGRAVMFAIASGLPITQRVTTPLHFSKLFIDGAGRAVAPMVTKTDSVTGPRQGFVRFTLNGEQIDTVFLPEHPRSDARWIVRDGTTFKFEMLVPLQPRDVHAVDPLGGWITGWSGESLLRSTRNGRDTLRLISWPAVSEAVSASEKAGLVEEKILEAKGQAPEPVLRASLVADAIPDRRPAFEQLHVDQEGRIWVRRASFAAMPIQFDLFDKDGHWLDVLSVSATGWPRGWWHPVSMARDRVAVLIETDDGRPAVRIYRLVRK